MDGFEDDRLIDGDVRAEPGDDFAAARDEELFKVPEKLAKNRRPRKTAGSKEMLQ